MESIRLPFRIKGMYGGAAKLEGFVALDSGSLALEYRLRDTFIGAFTGPIKTCSISLSDLEYAEGGLGFFSPWLLLSARTLAVFDKLPNLEHGRLRLRIPWKHRRQLRVLTAEINLQLSYRDADRYRPRLSEQGT